MSYQSIIIHISSKYNCIKFEFVVVIHVEKSTFSEREFLKEDSQKNQSFSIPESEKKIKNIVLFFSGTKFEQHSRFYAEIHCCQVLFQKHVLWEYCTYLRILGWKLKYRTLILPFSFQNLALIRTNRYRSLAIRLSTSISPSELLVKWKIWLEKLKEGLSTEVGTYVYWGSFFLDVLCKRTDHTKNLNQGLSQKGSKYLIG